MIEILKQILLPIKRKRKKKKKTLETKHLNESPYITTKQKETIYNFGLVPTTHNPLIKDSERIIHVILSNIRVRRRNCIVMIWLQGYCRLNDLRLRLFALFFVSFYWRDADQFCVGHSLPQRGR